MRHRGDAAQNDVIFLRNPEEVLAVREVPEPVPGPGQVRVRMLASPINPSDLGLLLAGADLAAAVVTGTSERPVVTAPLAGGALRSLGARVGTSLPEGNGPGRRGVQF